MPFSVDPKSNLGQEIIDKLKKEVRDLQDAPKDYSVNSLTFLDNTAGRCTKSDYDDNTSCLETPQKNHATVKALFKSSGEGNHLAIYYNDLPEKLLTELRQAARRQKKRPPAKPAKKKTTAVDVKCKSVSEINLPKALENLREAKRVLEEDEGMGQIPEEAKDGAEVVKRKQEEAKHIEEAYLCLTRDLKCGFYEGETTVDALANAMRDHIMKFAGAQSFYHGRPVLEKK